MPLKLREMKGSRLTHAELDENFGIERVSQTSHGFSAGDVVRESAADTYTKAQADADGNIGVGIGLVAHVIDANTFILVHFNNSTSVTLTAHGKGTFGQRLYLSAATAGLMTTTAPSPGWRIVLGYVRDANTIVWEPGWVRY